MWRTFTNALVKFNEGSYVLHEAARTGNCSLISDSEEKEVNCYSKSGLTALAISILYDHLDCACLLLDKGADANKLTEKDVNTYAFIERQTNNIDSKKIIDIINLLLIYGGDIDYDSLTKLDKSAKLQIENCSILILKLNARLSTSLNENNQIKINTDNDAIQLTKLGNIWYQLAEITENLDCKRHYYTKASINYEKVLHYCEDLKEKDKFYYNDNLSTALIKISNNLKKIDSSKNTQSYANLSLKFMEGYNSNTGYLKQPIHSQDPVEKKEQIDIASTGSSSLRHRNV